MKYLANWAFITITYAMCWCVACANINRSSPKLQTEDAYIVVTHVADGNRYVIRHGDVVIQAKCQYSTHAVKGNESMFGGYCLQSLPVGEQLDMTRGAGDWLFCNWKVRDEKWHMGLIVEKEELKSRKGN